jgi:hypothetical protein
MIVLIVLFVIVHFIAFFVYASYYSSSMQDLKGNRKRLNIKNMNTEKLQKEIEVLESNIKKYKRMGLISLLIISFVHFLFIVLSSKSTNIDYLYNAMVSIVSALFYLLIHYMKGEGTIDHRAGVNRGIRI